MKKELTAIDSRIKSKLFPISIFFIVYIILAAFTTIQMKIISDYIDINNLPSYFQYAIFTFWFLISIIITLFIKHQITNKFEKPIAEFAKATKKVAEGDFSIYISPRNPYNKSDYLDVIFMDFNKMVEELGSIETLKTDFFSNVSHEIKTPLAVIQNYTELLQKENITLEQRLEYTDNILQSTNRLSNLITNMLKLNKLEKQTINPMPEYYDLCEQLCQCALQFEDKWEEKDLEFIADIEDSRFIEADLGLLELVWNNLLSNAIKFTDCRKTITLKQTSTAEEVIISVSDEGCGMTEDTIKHIFDKFYQGDTSHATEGNGLGLALVKRILELSNSSIDITSTLNKGSTFTVRIPIVWNYKENI